MRLFALRAMFHRLVYSQVTTTHYIWEYLLSHILGVSMLRQGLTDGNY